MRMLRRQRNYCENYELRMARFLSDETYELNVREDASVRREFQPRERIFAGGVGSRADGLSSVHAPSLMIGYRPVFWEGVLNLSAGKSESVPHKSWPILLAPRATVDPEVRNRGAIDGQPIFSFVLSIRHRTACAWTDQFLPPCPDAPHELTPDRTGTPFIHLCLRQPLDDRHARVLLACGEFALTPRSVNSHCGDKTLRKRGDVDRNGRIRD